MRGADLYVVRLLQDAVSKARAKEQRRRHVRAHAPGPAAPHAAAPTEPPRYADSRPCWRCLEWMHWAGIKRVYWTNVDGAWEGGKITEMLFGTASSLSPQPVCVPVHLTQYEQALLRAHRV